MLYNISKSDELDIILFTFLSHPLWPDAGLDLYRERDADRVDPVRSFLAVRLGRTRER